MLKIELIDVTLMLIVFKRNAHSWRAILNIVYTQKRDKKLKVLAEPHPRRELKRFK